MAKTNKHKYQILQAGNRSFKCHNITQDPQGSQEEHGSLNFYAHSKYPNHCCRLPLHHMWTEVNHPHRGVNEREVLERNATKP